MSELKPCPFCGESAAPNGNEPIYCERCKAVGPVPYNIGEKDAIARWNRRAPSPVVAEVVKEMRKIQGLLRGLPPFDPAVAGFDAELRDRGPRQRAVCMALNALANGEWASRLERGE